MSKTRKFPPRCEHQEQLEEILVEHPDPYEPSDEYQAKIDDAIVMANEQGELITVYAHPDQLVDELGDFDLLRPDLGVSQYQGSGTLFFGSNEKLARGWDLAFGQKINQG